MSKHMRWLASLALALALAACGGGGGGGGEQTSAPVLPQGIWRASGVDGTLAVMVLPETVGGSVWAVGRSADQTTTSLYQASLGASGQAFSGTGTALTVVGSASPTSTPSLTVTLAAGSPSGQTMSFALNGEVGSLAYGSHYNTPASLTAASGTTTQWSGDWSSSQSVQGLGSLVTQWTVGTDGVISGSGTGGCSYAGTVSLRPESKAVVNVALTETCNSNVLQFSGIGVPGVDPDGNVVGRLVVLRRADGQSFSVMQWSPRALPPEA